MTYSIGEFSRLTRNTVKALRLYHEKGLLVPDFVDPESGYRYYSKGQVQEARVIRTLKEMGFSLGEIKETLEQCDEDGELVERLEAKRRELEVKIGAFRRAVVEIEYLMGLDAMRAIAVEEGFEVEEKQVPDMLVAGVRMTGQYVDVGKGFGTLFRHAGRSLVGKPMCLYYDGEYKEDDADFEAVVEVKAPIANDAVSCHVLPGGRAFSVMHKGPYERLSESYERLMDALKREGVTFATPTREIYHKGPGMLLKGNPEKYLTEILFLIEGPDA